MTENNFSATVASTSEGTVLYFKGDINGLAETEMNAAYSDAEQKADGVITLDFQKVEYINSTGIALIVGLLARARMSKCRIRATGLGDHYREIFTITRLSDFMELV